jgi:succinate dehydrogenase membrane anchor subunit
MVTNVTSLTGNGLRDWLIQRVSAIFIAAYAIFLVGFIVIHPQLNFDQWRSLFDCVWVQVATMIFLVSLMLHAWVGIWTVTTDYVKGTILRLSLQMLVVLFLLGLFIWGIHIFWG